VNTGIWGIEFDVQWTADGAPVVVHDADAGRVFGRSDIRIAEISARQLAQQCSEIPTLEIILDRYRQQLHLMIEIKSATFESRHAQTLKSLLGELEPGRDFHLLALEPQVLDYLHMFPPTALIPVAEFNTATICSLALRHGYGGVAGHYALLSASMRGALRQQGIGHGTGFVASGNVLRREIARGTEWIFTNRPGVLLDALRKMGSSDTK
jgi:glycerophosphoryl diester phosphodiesterase